MITVLVKFRRGLGRGENRECSHRIITHSSPELSPNHGQLFVLVDDLLQPHSQKPDNFCSVYATFYKSYDGVQKYILFVIV